MPKEDTRKNGYCSPCGECEHCQKEAAEYRELKRLKALKRYVVTFIDPDEDHLADWLITAPNKKAAIKAALDGMESEAQGVPFLRGKNIACHEQTREGPILMVWREGQPRE